MMKDKGLFVCVLADYNGSTNHCIGIDCETNLIYDAVDLKAKSLTKENIEYSTGLYENDVNAGIAGFADVAEIVKKRGKQCNHFSYTYYLLTQLWYYKYTITVHFSPTVSNDVIAILIWFLDETILIQFRKHEKVVRHICR